MTLEQRRAAQAYRHVHALAGRGLPDKQLYASMAQKLPILIRTAGLCQALHFVLSRDKPILTELLDHLAGQLQRIDARIADGAALCARARDETDLTHYIWMTREALASAEWYARLAQSELDIPRGTAEITP